MTTLTTLTTLLPSTTYSLAYSLPLMFISLVLTFCGAFLTLDRTRSFPASYSTLAPTASSKFRWSLEGGVGGLAIGYAFGLHLSTFLALLIPAVTTLSPLTSKSFIAVWLLPTIVTTFLAGRWKYAALTFVGISGGALFALSVSVIIHPSLLARLVFIAICIPIVLLFTLLPIPSTQHSAVRFASSATGAFGLVLSIAVLSGIPAWSHIWSRLWLADGTEWGTSSEQGLSAGFCLFLCFGAACDWALKRRFGECPDQKWDDYLSSYAAGLPSSRNREGTFRPIVSAWDRLFSNKEAPMIFPTDEDLKRPIPPVGQLHKHSRGSFSTTKTLFDDSAPPTSKFEFQSSPGYLKKARSQARFQAKTRTGRRTRETVKFRPGNTSGSDDDEDDLVAPLSPSLSSDDHSKVRPWLRQKASMASSTATLIEEGEELDYDKEKQRLHRAKKANHDSDAAPEYSDYEEDIAAGKWDNQSASAQEWSPGFLKKNASSTNSQRTIVSPTGEPRAVPATPSLIKALDRVAAAQKDAFGQDYSPVVHPDESVSVYKNSRPGLPHQASSDQGGEGLPTARRPKKEHKPARWDDFWKDVVAKAST